MQLDDADILEVIAELSLRRGWVGVPVLRTALQARHGASCGTDRLSRLLKQYRQTTSRTEQPANPPATPGPPYDEQSLAGRVARLEIALQEAKNAFDKERVRAELAEAREIAHQDKWADEIYELRTRLAAVNPERAATIAKECEYLRVQNRHLTRLVADLRLALAEAQLKDKVSG